MCAVLTLDVGGAVLHYDVYEAAGPKTLAGVFAIEDDVSFSL